MRRRTTPQTPSHLALARPATEPEPPSRSEDDALDTVAAILKTLGRTTRDKEAARTLDAWARHLLVLAAPPGHATESATRRDWRGARAFVLAHIQRRSESMEQRLAGMRDVMWEMIESISRSIADETDEDGKVNECMFRLRAALDAPTEELRRQAFGAIDELTSVIEEREQRRRDLAGTLGGRIAELSVELAEARQEAERDALTELANRSVFDRELERAAHLTTLTQEVASLLMVDIDDFKGINDTYGHPAGDAVLKAVSRTIVLTFPRRTDVVARYGGDEFALILANTSGVEAAMLAERLLHNLRAATIDIKGAEIRTTVSIGVAEIRPRMTAASIVTRADAALYAAKHGGRDRVSA